MMFRTKLHNYCVIRIFYSILSVQIDTMYTKLTLKLNAEIIEEAKKYAKESNTSLSKLIENYLSAITTNKSIKRKVNPIVESLTGIITLDDKKDYRKSYTKYLEEKYK